jgi:hypothetical protein
MSTIVGHGLPDGEKVRIYYSVRDAAFSPHRKSSGKDRAASDSLHVGTSLSRSVIPCIIIAHTTVGSSVQVPSVENNEGSGLQNTAFQH